MSRFVELVNEHWDGDAYSTAVAICVYLELPSEAQEVLLPVIADRARDSYRDGVRKMERVAFAKNTPTTPQQRNDFLSSGFPIPGGFVLWGEATIAEHLMRIEMLQVQRDGLAATQERHVTTIHWCEQHSVDRLNDLPPEVLQSLLQGLSV